MRASAHARALPPQQHSPYICCMHIQSGVHCASYAAYMAINWDHQHPAATCTARGPTWQKSWHASVHRLCMYLSRAHRDDTGSFQPAYLRCFKAKAATVAKLTAVGLEQRITVQRREQTDTADWNPSNALCDMAVLNAASHQGCASTGQTARTTASGWPCC